MNDTYDLVVKNGRLVLASGITQADVAVADGKIVAIGSGLNAENEIDANHLLVLPGLIDPHVHPIHAEDGHAADLLEGERFAQVGEAQFIERTLARVSPCPLRLYPLRRA